MNLNDFAQHWLKSWNSHDIEGVLAHFSEDVEVTTPMIKVATSGDEDTIYGKEAVRKYWTTALKKFPDLHFKLICITEGVNSAAFYYETVLEKKAIEVMYFNSEGLVTKMNAFYSLQE
ncbi:nuclear transport factor 2 family protein [Dyadobacter chenhuakuii]|jgi:hypothetical protein|uniref:Nuclear transport factor 2 family protein n=1 Tax=Dyadobacter chenhuakuii TaxID=2909339 RepID=A0A9X1TR82_9BACT|nr:nuclear transport factor 2 family protein [Dyadobacter chenhuakuii]MCF2496675.1 nuclear transport factor 2 family protein [Dyadobacter chenhuakuii]